MSIKTSKRIALGVIASLVFAPFAAIAPASASTLTSSTSAQTVTITAGTASQSLGSVVFSGFTDSSVDTIAVGAITGPFGATVTFSTVGGGNVVTTSSANVKTVGASASNLTEASDAFGAAAAAATAKAIIGQVSHPGTYSFTLGGSGVITVIALPASSTTSSLTALASTATPIAASTDITLTVARNAGAALLDGQILGEVTAVGNSAGTAPTTVGTIFGQDQTKRAGMTPAAAATNASTTFTMDLAAASASGSYGAGTYSFRFFLDVNNNNAFDANEVSTTLTVTVGGAEDGIAVSISKTVLTDEANYNTFTVTATITDANGGATNATVYAAETTSTGAAATANSGNGYTTVSPAIAASGSPLTRIGTSNVYTGTFTVDQTTGISTSALTYITVYTSNIAATADEASINSIRVVEVGELDETVGISAIQMEDKVGVGKYTAGVRDDIELAFDGTSSAVTVDTAVTSIKYSLSAAAGDEGQYLKVAVAPQGTTPSSVVAPSFNLVAIGADLTASYTVTTVDAVAATTTTLESSYKITIDDATGNDPFFTVSYATAAPEWTLSPSADIRAKFGDSISVTGTLADQFGRVLADKDVYVLVAASGRNGGRVAGKTDAKGSYTFTWKDASTSTTILTDSLTFNYDYVKTATSTTTSTATSAARKVTYSATGVVVGSVVLTIPSTTKTRPVDFAQTATGLPASGSTVVYTATVRDADGALVPSGVLVTFTGGEGDIFTTGTTRVTVSGVATITVYRQKVGSSAITASANGVTSATGPAVKWSNDLPNNTAADAPYADTADRNARYISLAADPASSAPEGIIRFVATVTDRFGNPVAGVAVTFSETGVGRFMTGQTNPANTNAVGQVAIDLSTIKGEVGAVSVSALITDADASQLNDEAGFITVNRSTNGTNTTNTARTAISGVTAAVKSATATATVAAPVVVTPEVVVPPEAPTLTGELAGRVLLFGSCMADEGDMIIYVKSPGKAWNEKAKTLECAAGEFDGSIKAPKNAKYYRVKQEGTGLWSRSVLIRP